MTPWAILLAQLPQLVDRLEAAGHPLLVVEVDGEIVLRLARPSRADLEEVSRRRATGVYYSEHRMLCRLLGEYLAFVDTRDLMLGPRLVLDGFWESWVTLAIARHLRPGMWCVDVGANYGYYTLLMAAGCGPEGRVVACEPNPILTETYLPCNLALNGFQDRVEICPKAVGNLHDCTVDFVLHDGDFATSSLERWSYSHASSKVQVPAITLDRLCADWPRLDLVKIDAEGARRPSSGKACSRRCAASRTRPSSWNCTFNATCHRRSASCINLR